MWCGFSNLEPTIDLQGTGLIVEEGAPKQLWCEEPINPHVTAQNIQTFLKPRKVSIPDEQAIFVSAGRDAHLRACCVIHNVKLDGRGLQVLSVLPEECICN